jgi:hypothetical protein
MRCCSGVCRLLDDEPETFQMRPLGLYETQPGLTWWHSAGSPRANDFFLAFVPRKRRRGTEMAPEWWLAGHVSARGSNSGANVTRTAMLAVHATRLIPYSVPKSSPATAQWQADGTRHARFPAQSLAEVP